MPLYDDAFSDNTNYNRRKEEEKANEQIRIEKERARVAALSDDERKKENDAIEKKRKDEYITLFRMKLNKLYSSVDNIISERNDLFNYERTTDWIYDNHYKDFKQTQFGVDLKTFLQLINKGCNEYIDRTFSNNNYSGFKVSAINCSGSMEIFSLYNYLMQKKFTNIYLKDYTVSQLETLKYELKERLSRSFVSICTGIEEEKDVKKMIQEEQKKIPIPFQDYKSDLLKIYTSLDTLFTNDGIGGGILFIKSGKETEFKKKLIDFLKDITLKQCNKSIKKIFNNETASFFTKNTCKNYSKIKELFEILINFEYYGETSTPYYHEFVYSNYKQKETEDLKKRLHESLIDICINENTKRIISDTPPPPPIPPQLGGNTKITKLTKKDILGKSRCIYKKSGDRKQYIKHKGVLIAVSEYKKIMTTKNK
jgi:hypothetical protein